MNGLRKLRAKAQLRRAFRALLEESEANVHGGGSAITAYLSPAYGAACQGVVDAHAKLAKLDPECPRLPGWVTTGATS